MVAGVDWKAKVEAFSEPDAVRVLNAVSAATVYNTTLEQSLLAGESDSLMRDSSLYADRAKEIQSSPLASELKRRFGVPEGWFGWALESAKQQAAVRSAIQGLLPPHGMVQVASGREAALETLKAHGVSLELRDGVSEPAVNRVLAETSNEQ